MTVLVTGGTGFVGTHIAAALVDENEVIAADLHPWDAATRRRLAAPQMRLAYAALDVRDAAAVRTLVQARGVRAIVHAAALTAPDSAANASDSVAVNLSGAVHVLDAALASPTVERVLLISSSGVYASLVSAQPLAEEDALALTSLYAIAKVSAERLAARYAELSGKLMAAVRLPAVYGPFERARPSRPHTSAPRRLMDALVAGREVRVAGPTIARDWTYAAEVGAGVRALLAAPRWSWSVYNLSNGLHIPFREVVDAFVGHGLRAAWIDEAIEADPADIALRAEDARAPLSVERLAQETGYRPRLSIAEGVEAWLRVEPVQGYSKVRLYAEERRRTQKNTD